jgi:transcriptional regulator with XRE-family HTH domain
MTVRGHLASVWLPSVGGLRMMGLETLAEYVRRVRNAKNLSLSDVERGSSRHGGKIAGSYVSRIENGHNNSPGPEKIKALARGLGVPEEELAAVAMGRAPKTEGDAREARLVARFRQLSPARQDDILKIVDTFHLETSAKKRQSVA